MKKYISIILGGLMMASCIDTVLLPDDKTVDEDFWKTNSDVSLMVNGAYKAMLNSDLMMRLIVWGDFRADELVPVVSLSGTIPTALTEIQAANISATNTFANWASLYSVINDCNIVLSRAEEVMAIDPSYTEGDYLVHRSQMLALRALCYFYLVRNFRDVPYSSTAFMNGSQDYNIPQSAPDSVLRCCIADLEEARTTALSPSSYRDWRRVGYLNRDGIDAILADIYLWRASVMHNAEDYEKCVYYCDNVIQSKEEQRTVDALEVTTEEFPWATGENAFGELYISQNASESIFELQFDGNSNSNTGLCQALFKVNKSTNTGYMKASSIFGSVADDNVFFKSGDYRFWNDCFNVTESEESFAVRKMCDNTELRAQSTKRDRKSADSREYDKFAQNFIIYRLTDILLLKAEALTQLAVDNQDVRLREGFNLVRAVNARSLYNPASDSLRWVTYNTKDKMEKIVLAERLRELCFEGKRWYDLLRYNYRHVEGIDYTTTMARIAGSGAPFVRNSKDMMDLATRKYSGSSTSIDKDAVQAKMPTEPYLYMPVPNGDVEVCPALIQNPAYKADDEYKKNY